MQQGLVAAGLCSENNACVERSETRVPDVLDGATAKLSGRRPRVVWRLFRVAVTHFGRARLARHLVAGRIRRGVDLSVSGPRVLHICGGGRD